MGISDCNKSKVERSGLVFVTKTIADNTCTSETMFKLVFPEADQRVFVGILKRCEEEQAYKLNHKEFIEWTRKALIRLAKGFYPDSLITDKSQYAVVYGYVLNFINKRNDKIKGYRNEEG